MTKMLATVLAATLVSAGAAFAAPAAKAPAGHAPAAVSAYAHAGSPAKAPAVKHVAGKVQVKYVGHLKKLPRHDAHKQPAAKK